ncbi:hypothetical protein ABWED_3264 (plasmid) [Acinetobacter lwoffii]|nr:hypothetical protein ABWED_3264 [Acinetobacter lwoffii]
MNIKIETTIMIGKPKHIFILCFLKALLNITVYTKKFKIILT